MASKARSSSLPRVSQRRGGLAEDGHLLAHVVGEAEALLVELDEQAPVVLALVERAEDLHHARLVGVVLGELLQLLDGVGVPGHLGDDGLELVDGAAGVGELGAEEARQGEAVGGRLLAVGGRLGAAQVEVGQIPIAAELGVELGERVERLGVGVLDVEGGAVGVDGLLGLGELDALEAGDGVERRRGDRRRRGSRARRGRGRPARRGAPP